MEFGLILTKSLSLLTLAGNLAALGLFLFFLIRRTLFDRVMRLLASHTLLLAFGITGLSLVGSLLYSEVVKFPACILCWIQRIFMYPLPFILGLAMYRKEHTILPYAFLLSSFGALVGLYQWTKDMLNWYGISNIPCPAVTGLPSCDTLYVQELSYITIPMISLNAFIWTMIVLWAGMRYGEKRSEV
jgi:disulfide bond formation protein DsbB